MAVQFYEIVVFGTDETRNVHEKIYKYLTIVLNAIKLVLMEYYGRKFTEK